MPQNDPVRFSAKGFEIRAAAAHSFFGKRCAIHVMQCRHFR
jgi:hypothetical protein